MSARCRIGVFGGTFNPPHIGHTMLISQICERVSLDKVIIIPAGAPPHKTVDDNEPMHRLAMTRLAFPDYVVSDMEIVRGGKSYTWETLEQLCGMYPDAELCFICGSDMFLSMDTWKRPEKVFELSRIVTASRDNGAYLRMTLKKLGYMLRYHARCRIVRLKPLVLSSTDIRQRLAADEDISDLVCPEVEKYIKENRLYRDD